MLKPNSRYIFHQRGTSNQKQPEEAPTVQNNEVFWFPFSCTDARGEDPSSDPSGTGEGGLAGI